MFVAELITAHVYAGLSVYVIVPHAVATVVNGVNTYASDGDTPTVVVCATSVAAFQVVRLHGMTKVTVTVCVSVYDSDA